MVLTLLLFLSKWFVLSLSLSVYMYVFVYLKVH